MNAQRRKELAKAQTLITQAKDIFEACASDEREAFENMPEGMQSSDRGKKTDEYVTYLEEQVDVLEEIANYDFSE